ncbi:hypothetical protein IW140_005139 [Coemansia sp. RSA 1813]|nr:hypothetical protein LPJ74_005693 [Coemansia sp. RSA 1843]KAJ2211962.1 hypothetical protein EV179_005069 [Coemansia sp. RSA 487]KAJ2565857.1 hypothetical protein IW140_005139 [Coemansia sp. RSA 1813]
MSTAEALADSEDFIRLASSSSEEERENDEQAYDEDEEREPLPNGKRAAEAAKTATENKTRNNHEICYNGQALPPWLKGHNRLGKGKYPDISDMINEEMSLFVKYISPTPEEHQMRVWVINRLQRVLDNMHLLDADAQALCFGSFATRLYLPTSDIDMTVMLYKKNSSKKAVAPAYENKEAVRRFLYTLAKHLKNAGFCQSCEVIAHARVPIIKTHEMITGIAVDISINADSGVQSAGVQKSFSEKVYPDALRSIVLVIKQFLSQRSMNEVYTGGIGSYAITLLAVSLFQTHPRVLSGGLQLTKNLGILLIEFFELYGKRFNYDNVCISVLENGRYLDKRRKGFFNMGQSYLLSIEDPCDTSNDVSKGTYGILRIKQTFGGAYDLINNAIFAYHQTRKHGEPINDTLRSTAAVSFTSNGSGDQSRRKRIKAMDGNARKATGGSGMFNDNPNAHVSFLSSILSVSAGVVKSRERLVREFYKGTMQKVLGVQYQPSLTNLLPDNSKDADTASDAVKAATEASAVKEMSAQETIATMNFDFTKSGATSGAPTDKVITISDGE